MNNLFIIAAIGKNNELGKNNNLIWRLHEDMHFFKEHTIGKDIVMGRKTFESLPGLLPKRKHIVLTKSNISIPKVLIFHNKEDILYYASKQQNEIAIIGGSSIYKLFIDDVDKMLLTEIDDTCKDADVFFPEFNQDEWYKTILSEKEENNIKYKHTEYIRKLTK